MMVTVLAFGGSDGAAGNGGAACTDTSLGAGALGAAGPL